MEFNLQPTLSDDLLILRPLKEEDFEGLYQVASDPHIWEQHPDKDRYKREVFEDFFKIAMASNAAFVVVDKKTNLIIGSSRFHPVKESQNAIEIGWTFLAREYWGGKFNKSMKVLMMEHAFKFVKNIIYFIGEHNIRSQRAVEKLGGIRISQLENQIIEPRPNSPFIYNIAKLK